MWSALENDMLKALGCAAPLLVLPYSTIAVAFPYRAQTSSRPLVAYQTGSEALPKTPDLLLTGLPRLKDICSAKDYSFLEQGLALAPRPATLPQDSPLAIPQQESAAAVQQTLSLNLPSAIRYAFDRNPDLQVVKLQLQRSCEQLRQAEAAKYPTVSVTGGASRVDNGSFNPLNRRYTGSAFNQTQVQQLLLQQQSQVQQQLQLSISQLQQRFQQNVVQVQSNTFQQQLQFLQRNSSAAAVLPAATNVSLLSPGAVGLPLSSAGASGAGNGNTLNGALNLSYSIYAGGQRSASIQAAEKQVLSSALGVKLQFQQLRQNVANRYIDLQQTQSLISIADTSVASAQETLRTTQLGEQAGIKTQYDVLQSAVTLANAQQNQSQARALLISAQRQLVQQIGLPLTVSVRLPEGSLSIRGDAWRQTLEQSIVLALNNRLELPQTLIQRQITQLQKRITRSQLRPQLQGFASVNVADNLGDRQPGALGYSVGVQASLNFFDGGSVKAQLRQLDQTLKTIDQQYNQLKEAIRFAVEQDYSTLQASATNIDTANQAVTQAAEGLRLSQLRYQAGVGTTLEIVNAQALLTQAQGNQVSAVLAYNRALANLEADTGYATVGQP